jgi:hypothetical protein
MDNKHPADDMAAMIAGMKAPELLTLRQLVDKQLEAERESVKALVAALDGTCSFSGAGKKKPRRAKATDSD